MVATITRNLFLTMLVVTGMEMAFAHGDDYRNCGGSRGWSMKSSCEATTPGHDLGRHRHHYDYPFYRRHYYYNRHPRDTFDFISNIFRMPFYPTTNSLFRQQLQQERRQAEDDTRTEEQQEAEEDEDAVTVSSRDTHHPFVPRYEVFENEDRTVELAVEVPGVAAKDLFVEVEGEEGVLRIRGSRTVRGTSVDDFGPDHGKEIYQTYEFDQSFQLGRDVDLDNISATLVDGILTVSVQKLAPLRKRIPIQSVEDNAQERAPQKDQGETNGLKVQTVEKEEEATASSIGRVHPRTETGKTGAQNVLEQKDAGLEISEEEDS